ncbi:hypothetical protein [Endothiovibrio diazotrophicus]
MKQYAPLLAAALLTFAGNALATRPMEEAIADNPDGGEAIPPSGLHATTTGSHVLLFDDGSWKPRPNYPGASTTAITDHGRTVELVEKADPAGRLRREWRFTSPSRGMIQVIVSRAITTDRSAHSNRDNCIPVITVRNLTDSSVFRLIAELEFKTEGSNGSAISVMLGPLDGGEEEEKVASPLFVPQCEYLSGTLHVPYCTYANGLDCRALVTTSRYGTIPLEMAPVEPAPPLPPVPPPPSSEGAKK